jgi:hypothetical protein
VQQKIYSKREEKMIERLTKIDPGWSPSVEHLNTIIRKLNDVIDAVNLQLVPVVKVCPQCLGTGWISVTELVGASSVSVVKTCPKCGINNQEHGT